MGDLSVHFSKAEFACHCCGELKVDPRLIDALEKLRGLAGKAIVVHDGYRCPTHNQEVGGVTNSEHTQRMASDVEIPGLSLQQMYELALQVPEFAQGGIGVYDGGFLHLDVRQHVPRWARVRGQYVGIQHLIQETVVAAAAARPPTQPAG
jgi:zinc D-Ala-D-Ala carboxypeptidase